MAGKERREIVYKLQPGPARGSMWLEEATSPPASGCYFNGLAVRCMYGRGLEKR